MERHIVHCDLDTFFVSVERLLHSDLNGKPVLVGGFSERSVVASCSYEARLFGVHAAMSMKQARRLCPQAVVVRGDFDQYTKYSRIVTEIIEGSSPVVEKASIDEHYIDLTGMDKYFGCWKWTQELRQRIIKETGLPISFALSANKTVSKIATGEAKPCNEKKVDNGKEKQFLAPLSIKKIPMVGSETYSRLKSMGIATIKTLQEIDPEMMQILLGANGLLIWRKANGLDDTAVQPYQEQKSMSKEHTYEQDTIDMELLQRTIARMVDELSFELRTSKKLSGNISIKIRYSNFETFTKQQKITYTCSAKTLEERAMTLFKRVYTKRLLIRLIGVKVSDLVSGAYQINLFDDTEEDLALTNALDSIRLRFGKGKIIRGSCF
ncbi:MAG TPA: DNA polymerase IV [Edaphocola sp.]|nr:DNA polymerase IV [Edaphocola sp.]